MMREEWRRPILSEMVATERSSTLGYYNRAGCYSWNLFRYRVTLYATIQHNIMKVEISIQKMLAQGGIQVLDETTQTNREVPDNINNLLSLLLWQVI